MAKDVPCKFCLALSGTFHATCCPLPILVVVPAHFALLKFQGILLDRELSVQVGPE